MDIAVTAVTGTTLLNQGVAVAKNVLNSQKTQDVIANIEKNPVLNHLIQLADKLVDIGKAVPFIAPAFVILKIIIDVEQSARDADAKCEDLLERINFMVSNITVLEKVRVIDPLRAVIEKMNDTLKQAASLIQAYRKQGAIARRLKMSNNQSFVQMATKISACSQDLMLSLQIQQTGDISVLSRSVPMDSQDEEAREFVSAHGGQAAINNSPELIEEFAKRMQLKMSDQVMDQMQTSMEDILEENQSRIEALLKENSSNTIAETIKALAADVREQESEQRLTCVQCDKEYRVSANGSEACSFHKSSQVCNTYSCCGKKAPCTFSNHRSVHHCEYPYTNFYDYAHAIIGFTDTTTEWATVKEKDMLSNETQMATVSKLIRWRTRHENITKPMMLIYTGRINFDTPYYLQAFDAEDLKAAEAAVRATGKTLIFKASEDKSQYSMVEWTLNDDGVIHGVKLSAKVATSDTATVKVVPIDITTVSLMGEVQTLSKATFKLYKPAEPYKLPESRHVGHILRPTPLREVREFKAESRLPLVVIPQGRMLANSRGNYVRNNADKFQGTLRIFNKAPPSSQTYVTLASCKAEYRFVGEKEYKDVESLTLDDVKFPVAIAPTQSADIPFEAIVRRNAEQAALMQNCWDWAMVALHHPVRIRITFKDIDGEECVFVQEYIHRPRKNMTTKNEKDLLFLHIDDILDGTRSVARVTKEEEDSDYVVSINDSRLGVEDLNKIVYKAELSGETEVNLGIGRETDSHKWDVWALIDLSCRRVYGFKVLVMEGSGRSKKTTASLGYAPCPIYGGTDLEEKSIQYAVEKADFPELELQEPLDVIEDDDFDDKKVVVNGQAAESVVAIATAASSSVTAALSEVSKATSSLDTTVFSSSMASLEKRLESLDTNVARMATALEKLVEILSP
ncbi:hypothetical protein BC939DRAFT_400693 [Gamsiella multidivaricata]|uniref:uncharacterized protein n=1 Tax=Gamsiella multidivaricata TaxID=101098 RepID=UPI00221FD7B9|nr:uncharacterized protein BC939DRAFT_400693 [Gamsiella multidivaricata]KAI7819137.1 hypothetical protein BC939DRAFT_400693 [Gamsiella multidivaricata]